MNDAKLQTHFALSLVRNHGIAQDWHIDLLNAFQPSQAIGICSCWICDFKFLLPSILRFSCQSTYIVLRVNKLFALLWAIVSQNLRFQFHFNSKIKHGQQWNNTWQTKFYICFAIPIFAISRFNCIREGGQKNSHQYSSPERALHVARGSCVFRSFQLYVPSPSLSL